MNGNRLTRAARKAGQQPSAAPGTGWPSRTVLHVCGPAAGGIRTHVLALLQGLNHLGYEPLLACPPSFQVPERRDSGGFVPRVYRVPLGGGFSYLADGRAASRLARLIMETRPALLHLHGLKAGAVGHRALGITGGRAPATVLTVHGLPACTGYRGLGPLLGRLAGEAAGRLAASFDRVIMVSQGLAADWSALNPDFPPTLVIPNGIDPAFGEGLPGKEDARSALDLPRGFPVVAVLSRLAVQKGLFDLLEAAALVHRLKPGIRFLLAGEGPEAGKLERRCAGLGLDDVVFFKGYQPSKLVLAAADLLVLPSHSEGLPLAALEALAAGVPVVASAVGGIPEVIRHRETGWLVAPRKPGELAEAVLEALSNREEGARRSEAGRQLVKRLYNLPSMIAATAGIYGALLGDRGLGTIDAGTLGDGDGGTGTGNGDSDARSPGIGVPGAGTPGKKEADGDQEADGD
ncbi:MAG: glycosyltransferase family 4 protein [Firmicutes bacterium]|nr:glycosyltransferase family 4 protein [Bacillota bacterium]